MSHSLHPGYNTLCKLLQARRRQGSAPAVPNGIFAPIERYPGHAFAIFCALHFVIWTALPAVLYYNLPLDVIEALTYGREWQLGYDKLPPLPCG